MTRPPSDPADASLNAAVPHAGDTVPPAAAPETGALSERLRLEPGALPLPDYRLVHFLGRGGYGEVWKALGPGGFAVALKFIPLGGAAAAVEERSAELLKTKEVRHPNLLGLFGSWRRDDLLILAMELADRTLMDRLKEALAQGLPGVPPAELLEYLREAAKGLDHLHALDVHHRDVKPQNLLLVGGGVKVADFGLAKLLKQTSVSNTGAMTPNFAAPEILKGRVSAHSDQYALAVAYCQLRGSRLPFVGGAAQVLTGHLFETPDLTMLPQAEQSAVLRALAKDPHDRWPSCRDFVEALAAGVAGLPAATDRTPRFGRRPWLALTLVGVLFLLTTALVIGLIGAFRTPPPADNSAAPGRADLAPSADAPSAPTPGKEPDSPPDKPPEPNPAKDIANSVGMRLTPIPAGKFLMGSPLDEKGRYDNEGPPHEVEITRPFSMSAYPVTRGQFAAFVHDADYRTEAETDGKGGQGYNAATRTFESPDPKYSWKNTGFPQGDDDPVVNVSWNDAAAFCAWLSKKEGKTYELPTEAEWEYACRAGTTTRFWCGDTDASLKGNANIADASLKGKLDADFAKTWTFASWDDDYAFTSPVGSFNKNPWGLYDMHGNVWQWCADGYGPYQEGYIKDPKGKESANSRVSRGGSCLNEPRFSRSADRNNLDPAYRFDFNGFRVVLRPAARTP